MTTFCWPPAESEPAGISGALLMRSASICRAARPSAASGEYQREPQSRAPTTTFAMLKAMDLSGISPLPRSPEIMQMLRRAASVRVLGKPSPSGKRTLPWRGLRSPNNRASRSGAPEPASPRISPARAVKLTPASLPPLSPSTVICGRSVPASVGKALSGSGNSDWRNWPIIASSDAVSSCRAFDSTSRPLRITVSWSAMASASPSRFDT